MPELVFREHVIVLFAFFILTSILTFPVVFEIDENMAGTEGDAFQFVWNIWHVEETISEGGTLEDIYFTEKQFYPDGADLSFHTLTLTNTLILAYPLTLITGNYIMIYNILILATFVFSGYFMYLLMRYLIKDGRISFIVAFAFAFAPQHFARTLGHLNLASIYWLPLFMLFFLKSLKERRLGNPILASILLVLLSLASWHLLVMVTCISFFYIMFIRLFEKDNLTTFSVRNISLLAVIYLILISPFAFPMINSYFDSDYSIPSGFRNTRVKLSDYIRPNTFSPVLGDLGVDSNPEERNVGIGYAISIISLFFLITCRKKMVWAFLSMIFLVFSIWPDNLLLEILFSLIPFFDVTLNTGRFSIAFLFSALIFFGYGLKHLSYKSSRYISRKTSLRKRMVSNIFLIIILIVVVFEFLSVPHSMVDGKSEEIDDLFENLGIYSASESSILSLPLYKNSVELYFQTYHELPVIGGYVSRQNSESLRNIIYLDYIIRSEDIDSISDFFKHNNIEFVFVFPSPHSPLIPLDDINTDFGFLSGPSFRRLYGDGPFGISVYEFTGAP